MGPPASPRETRRSGRRSAPSAASKSPDSDQPPPPPNPKERASTSRTGSSSNTNRNKRTKLEDDEEGVDDRKLASASSNSSASTNGGKPRKKNSNGGSTKDKEKDSRSPNGSATAEDAETVTADDQPQEPGEEEEEQGITRCVCGSSEDDPDAGEFMVQCEDCKVWQHGPCMGYQTEAQIPEDDYYCELCRPDMHVDLLKRSFKRPRQSSGTSAASRVSRSHSPSTILKQQSAKRRNTMNSRDAAFDESLKEVLEATAAEAAGLDGVTGFVDAVNAPPEAEGADNKKKRKRTEDDSSSTKKRTRSASTTSDRHSVNATFVEPAPPMAEKPAAPVPPKSTGGGGGSKSRRKGGKALNVDVSAADSEEGASVPPPPISSKKSSSSRHRPSNAPKRPPLPQSISASVSGSGAQDPSTPTGFGPNGSGAIQASTSGSLTHGGAHTNRRSGAGAAEARAYRQTHAYAVSQQTLYTSWNLPDYLSHLEEMLPSGTPQPLEVRGVGLVTASASVSGEAGAATDAPEAEKMIERGVKVKWPAKRMSVVDMNKRVRSLVEWVGREQASAADRGRRREALESALREAAEKGKKNKGKEKGVTLVRQDDDVEMGDGANDRGDNETRPTIEEVHSPPTSEDEGDDSDDDEESAVLRRTRAADLAAHSVNSGALERSRETMRDMEKLMEELIGFQERFGPGATKVRERERRGIPVAA